MRALVAIEMPGQPMCYEVTSSDGSSEPQLVRLDTYEGNGFCTCMDFQTRCIKNINKQKAKYNGKFHRIDYIEIVQVELVGANKTKLYPLARRNKKRTRCKHIIPATKLFTDTILNSIAEDHD